MVDDKFSQNKVVRYARWVIRNRWLVIFLSLALAFGAATGMRHIGFSNDYRVFFGKDNPQLIAFEEVEKSYTKSDNVMFVVSPKNKRVFTRRNLEAIQWLTNAAWQVPYSTRVDSITNFQHTKAVGDDLYVDNLVSEDAVSLTSARLREIKETALAETILLDRLVTKNADITGVNVSIQVPQKDPKEVPEVAAYVRKLRSEFLQQYPDFNVGISGVVMMNNAFAEMGQRDAMTLTPIMYLIMIVIMAFLLRSFFSTLSALAVIMLSTITTMGIVGYLGIKLTPPSAIAPTIILTLAIADSVHILVSMLLFMRKGWKKVEALVESLRINMQAVFLTSFTTMIGFLSLNFSDSPPYHDLGNITAIGVFAAFVFSVTMLPALVSFLPVRAPQKEPASSSVFSGLADFVVRRYRGIIVASVVVIIFLASFIPRIDLNDQFVEWFDKRLEFRNDTDYMIDHLTGIYGFEYSIYSGAPEGVNDPVYMQRVQDFANWWKQQPEVMYVDTYTDIMKKINKSMNADNQDFYKLPNDFDLSAQYLLLYEMSLPFGLDLNNRIDIDKSAVKVTPIFEKITSTQARELAARGDQWLKDNGTESMHATATGPSIMFSHISKRNVDSMIKGSIIAFILITLVLIVALKSWRLGILSLVPNTVPAIMAFGIWSILFTQVGMAISIVASATLGIIVDDSVHFITKYIRSRREGGGATSSADSVRYAFNTVGLAIVVTSFILIAGFGALMYSSFLLNWSLGVLSVFTICMALLADFFFLPALLIACEKKSIKAGAVVQDQVVNK